MIKGEVDSMESECNSAVSHLKNLNVKVLAVDFDLTTVDTHTGGRWKDSSDELATHVRPLFKNLLPLANASGLMIAIVTFSSQVDLIRKALTKSLEDNEFVQFMPIEGGIFSDYRTVGKKKHIKRAVKKLEQAYPGVEISRSSILLIDDDLNNIRLAETQGYRSIALDPDDPEDLLQNIIQLS